MKPFEKPFEAALKRSRNTPLRDGRSVRFLRTGLGNVNDLALVSSMPLAARGGHLSGRWSSEGRVHLRSLDSTLCAIGRARGGPTGVLHPVIRAGIRRVNRVATRSTLYRLTRNPLAAKSRRSFKPSLFRADSHVIKEAPACSTKSPRQKAASASSTRLPPSVLVTSSNTPGPL